MNEEEQAFILELIDHVSKPAREMKEELFSLGVGVELLSKGLEKLAEKSTEWGKEALRFSIEAAEFKEDTQLAYAAVLGTAEAGEDTFQQIDALARKVHMPAEQAHDIASKLMLQGLQDTDAISKLIEARAALMRTGQIAGAEKLMKIAERSIVSGHLAAGKNAKAFAGLGISDALAKELGKGQTTVEAGLEKISNEIINGPIGKVAAKKFTVEDFFADVGNAIRGAAQDSSLDTFNASLQQLDETLKYLLDDDGVREIFQDIADGAGAAIGVISELIDWTWGVVEATGKALSTGGNDWKEFSKIATTGVGWIVKGLKYFVTFIYGGALEAINTIRAAFEGLGATAAFIADVITHPLESQTARWEAYKRTLGGIGADWKKSTNAIGDLEVAMIDGSVAASRQEHQHKKVADAAHHAGKQIEFMADKAKAAKQQILGIEDLVLIGNRLFSDKEAGGFIPQLGKTAGSFAAGDVTPTAMAAASSTNPKSNTAASPTGGRSVLWTGNVYVDRTETNETLRPVVESAFIDAVDRLRLELGG